MDEAREMLDLYHATLETYELFRSPMSGAISAEMDEAVFVALKEHFETPTGHGGHGSSVHDVISDLTESMVRDLTINTTLAQALADQHHDFHEEY